MKGTLAIIVPIRVLSYYILVQHLQVAVEGARCAGCKCLLRCRLCVVMALYDSMTTHIAAAPTSPMLLLLYWFRVVSAVLSLSASPIAAAPTSPMPLLPYRFKAVSASQIAVNSELVGTAANSIIDDVDTLFTKVHRDLIRENLTPTQYVKAMTYILHFLKTKKCPYRQNYSRIIGFDNKTSNTLMSSQERSLLLDIYDICGEDFFDSSKNFILVLTQMMVDLFQTKTGQEVSIPIMCEISTMIENLTLEYLERKHSKLILGQMIEKKSLFPLIKVAFDYLNIMMEDVKKCSDIPDITVLRKRARKKLNISFSLNAESTSSNGVDTAVPADTTEGQHKSHHQCLERNVDFCEWIENGMVKYYDDFPTTFALKVVKKALEFVYNKRYRTYVLGTRPFFKLERIISNEIGLHCLLFPNVRVNGIFKIKKIKGDLITATVGANGNNGLYYTVTFTGTFEGGQIKNKKLVSVDKDELVQSVTSV